MQFPAWISALRCSVVAQ